MLDRIDRGLHRLETTAMIFFMALAILITVLQVGMRYLLNAPLFWAEEVVLFAVIMMSFMGISLGVTTASHISVDIIRSVLPARFVRPFTVMTLLLGAFFGVVLTYLGGQLALDTLARGQLSPALRIPMAYIYAFIPFAGCATVFRYLFEVRRLLRGDEAEASDHTPHMM